MSSRVIAIDFGHARIGIAVSDPKGVIATPLETIRGSKDVRIAAKLIAEAISKASKDLSCTFSAVVLGLPLHLNGNESIRSQETRALAPILEQLTGIPVRLFDERMTSIVADQALQECSFTRKKRASHVDSVASVLLLQCFLDAQSRPLP